MEATRCYAIQLLQQYSVNLHFGNLLKYIAFMLYKPFYVFIEQEVVNALTGPTSRMMYVPEDMQIGQVGILFFISIT